jgi:hypothetical protein
MYVGRYCALFQLLLSGKWSAGLVVVELIGLSLLMHIESNVVKPLVLIWDGMNGESLIVISASFE